jgi:hypothetical protein
MTSNPQFQAENLNLQSCTLKAWAVGIQTLNFDPKVRRSIS